MKNDSDFDFDSFSEQCANIDSELISSVIDNAFDSLASRPDFVHNIIPESVRIKQERLILNILKRGSCKGGV